MTNHQILTVGFTDFDTDEASITIAEGDIVLMTDGEGKSCEGVVVGEQRTASRYSFKVHLLPETFKDESVAPELRESPTESGASGEGNEPAAGATPPAPRKKQTRATRAPR